jgi:uncharacterized integral membrane protein (TIGR00698 family)
VIGEARRAGPGVALAAVIMLAAGWLAGVIGAVVLRLQGLDPAGRTSPISGIVVAIILGMVIGNTVRFGPAFRLGFQFAIRRVLRLGIILVGLRLSFLDVVKLGAWGVPMIATIILTAMLVTILLARWLRVGDTLGILTAAATSICGVTATVAVAPVIEADDREVAYTIANVTFFGIVAMFTYPLLAHALFQSVPTSVGLFLGTAIHETAQVVGAALSYRDVFGDDLAFQTATVTKLTRNVFLVAVIPALGWYHARRAGQAGGRPSLIKLFPVFVLGFLAAAITRSIGEATLASGGSAFGVWDSAAWKSLVAWFGDKASYWALGTAMAAVGLTTDLRIFRTLGLRPVYLGALVTVLVAALSLGLAALIGPWIGAGPLR